MSDESIVTGRSKLVIHETDEHQRLWAPIRKGKIQARLEQKVDKYGRTMTEEDHLRALARRLQARNQNTESPNDE